MLRNAQHAQRKEERSRKEEETKAYTEQLCIRRPHRTHVSTAISIAKGEVLGEYSRQAFLLPSEKERVDSQIWRDTGPSSATSPPIEIVNSMEQISM